MGATDTVSFTTYQQRKVQKSRGGQTSILISPDIVMEALHCGSTSIVLAKQNHAS